MRSLRRKVMENDVARWSTEFLSVLTSTTRKTNG
jgi:trehalose-6-phosphate synthase